MKNALAALFVAVFLAACGTYTYTNTNSSHRGSLLNAPDHMGDLWRERARAFE